jgi:WD40 repeat protein
MTRRGGWRVVEILGLAAALVVGSGSKGLVGMATAQAPTPYLQLEPGQHTAGIKRIGVDQAERWLVTVSDDKTARVWDLTTGRLARILRPPIGEGSEGKLFAVAISPDGQRVVVGGFTGALDSGKHPIYVFDRASGQMMARSVGYATTVNHLAFSPDGTRIAATFGPGLGMRLLRAADLTELARDDDCTAQGYGADFDRAGRLITTCFDGVLRLYDARGQRLAARRVEGGNQPYGVRFSPDGTRVAVGFQDTPAVTVVSGGDLSRLYLVDTRIAANGELDSVAWSADGQQLYAGGTFKRGDLHPVVVWPNEGRGAPTLLAAATSTIRDLRALARGRVAFGSYDPAWGVLGPTGQRERVIWSVGLDHRDNQAKFRVAADGRQIEFGFDVWDGQQWTRTLARFDLDRRVLEVGVSPGAGLTAPRTTGLPVGAWEDSLSPTFNGQPLTVLQPYERSRALAVARDASGFILGTEWWVRSFDATGQQRWRQRIPGIAWAVNLTEDGRFVVAALGDGTIRWYDAATGKERLGLFVHARDRRWVLWTPEGFYEAAPGADALIGYHLNQGPAREGQFIDAAQLAGVFYRPDLISRRLAGDEAAVAAAVSRIGDVRAVLAGGLPPRVELLSAATVETAGEYELTVRVTPTSGGAGPLRLRINGMEVAARGDAPPGGGTVTQRLMLAPGRNVVSVAGLTRDGKVASPEVQAIVTVKAPADLPTLRVLAVGVSQYDDASFSKGVQFAARDAEAVVRHLQAGAKGVYRTVDPVVLTRLEETRLAPIERALAALVQRARPEDVVVIFLAGHGKAQEGEYHFIPSDFLYTSDDAYRRGGTLSHGKLEQLLKNLGAGKRLLILDTCQSGAAIVGRTGSEEKDALARLMRSSGRYILAAASPLDKALEDPKAQHGIYTRALMEGLAGAADPQGTGRIEVDELAKYVERRVPELTAPYGYRQVPMRSAAGQSFWITNKTPAP